MCLLHGLIAELSVKTNIVKVLLCDLENNRLTHLGSHLKKNIKIFVLLQGLHDNLNTENPNS